MMRGSNDQAALRRARGLGTAKSGVSHWWWQRVTAAALVPLAIWLLAALISVAGEGRQALSAWLSNPVASTLMIALIVAMVWHMALGLTVIAEDYLHHEGVKFGAVTLIQIGCAVLAVAGVVSVLWLALGHA